MEQNPDFKRLRNKNQGLRVHRYSLIFKNFDCKGKESAMMISWWASPIEGKILGRGNLNIL